jgi:hypothetical protein
MQYQSMTYTATIYCGLSRGYDGRYFTPDDALEAVREYTAKTGVGVTVTPTYFVYRGQEENGVTVGLYNYPPDPAGASKVEAQAKELAKLLKKALNQERVSIIFPDHSVVIEGKENAE